MFSEQVWETNKGRARHPQPKPSTVDREHKSQPALAELRGTSNVSRVAGRQRRCFFATWINPFTIRCWSCTLAGFAERLDLLHCFYSRKDCMVPAASPWIVESTTARFENDVVRASQDRPIVIDFWAPWCAPCRQLTPILEKLATEFNGRFQLVKINIDENPELADAFRVQSIPYVAAVRDGRPIAEFMGVHP